jgi:hypothetical protein
VDRLLANKATPAEIIETLDQISRRRELERVESLFLERAILLQDGKPIPHGLTKALTRLGVKRDRRIRMARA